MRHRRTDRIQYYATETEDDATQVTGLERPPKAKIAHVDVLPRVQLRQ